MQQKNGISTTSQQNAWKKWFQEPQKQVLDQRPVVVWVGPGGPGGFGALLGVPLSFVTRTLSFSVILKSGIQLLPVFFVGTAYGMWGFILEKKDNLNKDKDSCSTIWGMFF